MSEFNLDEFIAKLNQDKPSTGNKKDQVLKFTMNSPDYQGTLNFMPVFSKTVGSFYKKYPRVYEFYGNTSLVESGEAWIKVLSKEDYGTLTESQSSLYDEVVGLLKTLKYDYELSYEELRIRDYSVFFGIGMTFTKDGVVNDTFKDQPGLFVYPNLKPIASFATAANAFKSTYSPEALAKILNTNPTGRRGLLQLSFTKSSTAAGYDSSMNFLLNSEFAQVISPDYTIKQDILDQFDNIDSKFLGWQYDRVNNSLFNEILFKELRDGLMIRLNEASGSFNHVEEVKIDNKNNLTPTDSTPSFDKSVPF